MAARSIAPSIRAPGQTALNLLDVTDAIVYEKGNTVQGVTGSTTFNALKSAVGTKDGWYIDFDVHQDIIGGVTVQVAELTRRLQGGGIAPG